MSKQFTIKIMGQVFESDEDGFLNLNDIWNGCNLPDKKRPRSWRNDFSRSFLESTNLYLKEIKHLGAGTTKYYAGDEEATIGYAMFVSVDFYREVVKAFVALRQGNIVKAVEIAADTMSEDGHYLNRQSRLKGMTWDESCAWAGIYHSQKCREMLMAHPKFKYFDKHNGKYFVTEDGQDTEYFYDRRNKFTKNTTMRVSPEGRKWLRDNRDWFNRHTKDHIENPFTELTH